MSECTLDDYSKAVLFLAILAQGDTSGSRAAAQVLLSAYNGDKWQLDVTDLGVLDSAHYQAAITVIRGRNELMLEPHRVLEKGNKIFESLWDQWSMYHVSKRARIS